MLEKKGEKRERGEKERKRECYFIYTSMQFLSMRNTSKVNRQAKLSLSCGIQ